MVDGLFVTGGSGFVGRRLLKALPALGRPVYALQRTGGSGDAAIAGVQQVAGDLLEPATYAAALSKCRTVLHLAASTGRAAAADHLRTNAEGTARLLAAAKTAGVTEFLFVSSIAAAFPDTRGYHYAIAKRTAEESVRASGIPFLIIRPTIILGPGAPILGSLEKLALLPVTVVPGSGRVRVQPIHVDDVVRCLMAAARDRLFAGETVAIGGPDVVSFRDLLGEIRRTRKGATGGAVRVPLPALQTPLRMAEAAGLTKVLPITAGQLTSFKFDGLAEPNRVQESAGGPWRNLAEMIASEEIAARPALAAASRPVLEAGDISRLEKECRLFARHLVGLDANPYIVGKYIEAHRALPALQPASRFDRLLLGFARSGRITLALADAYAGVFAKASSLRKRLVLTLALLETSAPFFERVDAAAGRTPTGAFVRLAVRGTFAVAVLAAGTLVLLPIRLVAAVLPRNSA
jgi:nucleoside-diphosphate-sugar epimerase